MMTKVLKNASVVSLVVITAVLSACLYPQALEQSEMRAMSYSGTRTHEADKLPLQQANHTVQSLSKKLNRKSHGQVTEKSNMNSKDPNKAEAVSQVSFNGSMLKASVMSFGCTSSENFIVEHEVVNDACQVTIRRTKPDLCRRAAFVTNIEIEWTQPEDCADLALNIANPILVTAPSGNLVKRLK